MGDGPGYDYGYAKRASIRETKLASQTARRDALLAMLRSIGFGDSDGELTAVDEEVIRHLKLALELLSLQTRMLK
jgi:hypothetical protein